MTSIHSYLLNKRRLHNWKPLMKFYIGKDLYDLFDYAVRTRNEIEFFTLNPNYKEIWSKLRVFEHYGHTKLNSIGWNENYHCYCVDVFCPDLVQYVISWRFHHWCSTSDSNWKAHARFKGWVDEDELEEGCKQYRQNINDWFERNYGKHISGLSHCKDIDTFL